MTAPPDLIHYAVAEILLGLPPDDLVRAAVVCKLWHRILSYPDLRRRYRDLHRTPPLLGFLHNTYRAGCGSIPHFIPVAGNPFPLQALDGGNPWWVADCRHGRVLIAQQNNQYAVWDPITGVREELPHKPVIPHETDAVAAVLCAVTGCDHKDCHGGPFKVILLCSVDHPFSVTVHACVYSSEARAWGTPVSALTGSRSGSFQYRRGALAEDVYYCNLVLGDKIVKYELGSHTLSAIDPPQQYDDGSLLMPEEGGSLGLAGITGSRLYLWSRMVNPEGIAGWIQQRVIELDKLFLPFGKSLYRVNLSAFAEGVRFIIMTSGADVFVFAPKSGRVRNVIRGPGEEHYSVIFPFMSFYTLDFASRKLSLPAKT